MKQKPQNNQPRGFALVVTLSLMILLTVIAVGLLTLSSVSLRTANQSNSMSVARANARLALMLAIGDLQRTAGPDQRITAPANLVDANAAPGVTGVWQSWRPPFQNPDYTGKSAANFLGYLISGSSTEATPDPAKLPDTETVSKETRKLVGARSVGQSNTNSEINAPVLSVTNDNSNKVTGGLAWVTMDEGVKGRIDLMPAEEPKGIGESITQVGAPANNGFETVEKMDFLKKDNEDLSLILPKLVSLNQVNLEADAKDATAKYFHDFTVSSNSLQVDVANGGLKTDLSVLFDGAFGASLPTNYSNRYLYSDTNTPFQGASTTSDVQWSLYANYARLYRRTTANDNPKAGLKAALPTSYSIKSTSDATLKKPRFEPNAATLKQPMLMPTVLRVDTIFGLVTHDSHHPQPGYPYMLFLTYLPVITLHNPFNVPLKVNNLQVSFSDIPIGFEFLVNGQATTTAGLDTINKLYSNAALHGSSKTFNMQVSNTLNGPIEVVMGPGETRIFGTPFNANSTWGDEVAKNGDTLGMMFDWQSNQTAAPYTKPGMITPANIGVGFHVDWLARADARAPWVNARKNDGVVVLKADDTIKVRYGPKVPTSAASTNAFAVTVKMGAQEAAKTQVFYLNESRLKAIMEEGVSERFPEKRTFPESYPRASESPINTMSIYESNTTPIKGYSKARPFAVFSVSAKTTKESFTMSRPVTDTGIAMQMATCDFTTSASGGSSPLEFALVPVKSGGNSIESGGITDSNKTSLQAFFFGGHGSLNGSNNATIYEIPQAPLQSIAQLRNANGGSIGAAPYVTYTVGESRAHPAVPADAAFYKPDASRTVLDRAWLANDQLWDKYWFSTLSTLQGVAYTGSAASTQDQLAKDFFSGVKKLPNARNLAYLDGKTPDEAADAARTTGGARSAAHIMTQGGFNVNSTSIPAWTSVLSSLSKSDVMLASGLTEKDPKGTPFLRIRQPVIASDAGSAHDAYWNSYRTLESDDIKKLAEEIVTEVRTRGPFLSMAEFVNRRLTSPGDLSNKGALQAALDRSKVNDLQGGLMNRAISPNDVSSYGWQNPSAVTGTTAAGGLGDISQGDILSAIGSFVTVRSDTFIIRAAGDARDGNGNIVARAWCEATIQRVPEYVDATDLPDLTPPVQPANINFGRRFNIISFKWLNESEI